jgi:hypothetical protein
MTNIVFAARKIVINAQNIMPPRQETFAEMGAKKSGSAGHEYFFSHLDSVSIKVGATLKRMELDTRLAVLG